MSTVREIMEPAPLTVSPECSVRELAELLLERGLDGACVLEGDRLVGVVTSMDLVFQEKKLHIPSFLTFLDVVIPLGSVTDMQEEMRKMAGVTVGQIMSTSPYCVGPDTSTSEAATVMVREHYTVLPVVEEDRLLGLVTKRGLVRAAYGL